MTNGEKEIVVLVILGLIGVAVYRLWKWLATATRPVEPWNREVDEALERGDAVPLCEHCLTPQEHSGWFCPGCGATVGPYCNYLPYVYPFSIGESLRAGVTGRLRCNWVIKTGYVGIALAFIPILLVPVYLGFLFVRLRPSSQEPAGPSTALPRQI